MKSVNEAIEDVYKAFANVSKPRIIGGCPCCIDGKEVDKLLVSDLRDVPAGDLSSYASSAFLTVGSVKDYLYFLPRILEISATDESWWPDPEVTGRAIRTSEPFKWTDIQLTALKNFLGAVLDTVIESANSHLIDTWMCVRLVGWN